VSLRLTRAAGGAEPGWADTLAGTAVALAASPALAAVGLADGTVQVYSRRGRRLLPGIALGATPAFLAADHPAFPCRLLVVTTDGAMRVWDFAPPSAAGSGSGGGDASADPVAGGVPACLVDAGVGPLILGGGPDPVSIAAMRLSGGAGLPLAVLTDMTAAAYHPGLRAWLRVADTAFPGSAYGAGPGCGPGAGADGDLHAAQVAASAAGPPGALAPMLALASAADQSRAHLEANVASAAALGSSREYRGWLLTYSDFLARSGDEGRLREAVAELMGPAGYGGSGGGGGASAAWAPAFLGLDRRALLRDVLAAVGKHRGCQRFVAEVSALLEHAG
jgi:protein HIRA/HIR1